MRFLVVGGSGYLGGHLIQLLVNDEHEVINFDNNSGNVVNTNLSPYVTNILGDIRYPKDLSKIEKCGKINGVFHLAAKKSVPESVLHPHLYEQVNVDGTKNLINFCKVHDIQNFVFTSSAAVYGEIDSRAQVTEQNELNPINPYGRTKNLAEVLLQKSVESDILSGFSLRIFNMVGASEKEFFDKKAENVLPVIVKSLVSDSVFTVNGNSFDTKDGTCVRDYVNVKDVAQAHKLAMEHLQSRGIGTYKVANICTGIGTSILDIIDFLNNVSEKRLNYRFGEKRSGDPSSVVGSYALASQLLGWSPSVPMFQSVRESVSPYT